MQRDRCEDGGNGNGSLPPGRRPPASSKDVAAIMDCLPLEWAAAKADAGGDGWNLHQLACSAAARGTGRGPPIPRLHGPLCVLVVDDDRDTVNAMARLLELWGHAALQAYSAAAALAVAAIAPPDVVLLDIAMPNMDGCELARRLRGDLATKDCLLIAITGYSGSRHRQQCETADIDVCLLKPVDPSIVETLMHLECARLGRTPREECPAPLLHRV